MTELAPALGGQWRLPEEAASKQKAKEEDSEESAWGQLCACVCPRVPASAVWQSGAVDRTSSVGRGNNWCGSKRREKARWLQDTEAPLAWLGFWGGRRNPVGGQTGAWRLQPRQPRQGAEPEQRLKHNHKIEGHFHQKHFFLKKKKKSKCLRSSPTYSQVFLQRESKPGLYPAVKSSSFTTSQEWDWEGGWVEKPWLVAPCLLNRFKHYRTEGPSISVPFPRSPIGPVCPDIGQSNSSFSFTHFSTLWLCLIYF